ncbi:hypothetical protein F4V57_00385 [Acinetobacter qingfengensis]|uniref:Outer membrane protein beta-barrel domain-containing protein n=1 Tax=Acinetobacter qingfengensis TaxID=1262585 RepID=A0A1E7RDH4_9GAMM|nr:hypothetical protein [Acinetobacter qingfengensis]KAA8735296.1 hypothetical protein F4V57_00385 [Acinetobacter qingfengensis]OEY97414.1 hypothetical protein BJI46_09940 [Acinetobacter qingfengensis]
MKILKLVAMAALAGSATFAMADEKVITDEGVATFSTFKPAQVRAEVGTTGYGGAFSWNVNPKTAVTVGYNGGDISWSPDVKVNGKEYDTDLDNSKNAYINVEYRPWANWFYVAGGVGYLDQKSSLTKTENGVAEAYNYRYDNVIAPYVGLGVSPSITSRFGVFGEIGTYYAGNPDASFAANDTKNDTEQLRKLNDASKYAWLPVAKVGLSYRF